MARLLARLRVWPLCAAIGLLACGAPGAGEAGDVEGPRDACLSGVEGDELVERRGTDCLCCHGDEFTVAGTLDASASGHRLRIEDAAGRAVFLDANAYDNFFVHVDLTPPFAVARLDPEGGLHPMRALAPHGSCNRCHRDGDGEAPPIGGR